MTSDEWNWCMDYCKKQGNPPAQAWSWNAAKLAYKLEYKMSITIKQWEQIVEEFRELAFERLTYTSNYQIMFFDEPMGFESNKHVELMFNDIPRVTVSLKPLPELITHDIEFYGLPNALLIWSFDKKILDNPEQKNCNFESITNELINNLHSRKTSEAMPFDLERAMRGDVVEFNGRRCYIVTNHDDNIKIRFDGDDGVTYLWVSASQLRMNYPPRTQK